MTAQRRNRAGSLSMGFPRREYWSALPLSFPGGLPDRGVDPGSPTLQAADSLPSESPGKPWLLPNWTQITAQGWPQRSWGWVGSPRWAAVPCELPGGSSFAALLSFESLDCFPLYLCCNLSLRYKKERVEAKLHYMLQPHYLQVVMWTELPSREARTGVLRWMSWDICQKNNITIFF